MDNELWGKIESIVDEALAKPEKDRKAFIKYRCKNNPDLFREVLALLGYITASEGWLENSGDYQEALFSDISDDLNSIKPAETLIGKQVGAYTLTEELARGGMGTVYLAKRTDGDFDHKVAIKIISRENITPDNLQRFKQEQKILAKLSHPGIAQLYDGGVTENGFPYIIMEFVNGVPITEYCDQIDCSIQQTIKLFKEILKAVRYAHENLIIHRDLKPDNILIDKAGNIKILDFGISKLLDDEENLLLTKTGSKVLTPRYAAPEQIKQENITTATDMYSLGVILYRLLTGTGPLDLDELTQYQVEQAIISDPPKRPSACVPDPKLRKKLSGDLDAILLKSIRKEPESRYRFVSDFLNDLENYEKGRPVSARQDSINYRTRKFLNRHIKGLTITTVFVLILVAVTAFYTFRITEQRNIAQAEAKKAMLVQNLILDIFKANDPILSEHEDASLQQLLEIGTEQIRGNEITADIRIELLLMLSNIYNNITEYGEAKKLADESLEISLLSFGEKSVLTGRSYMQIGSMQHQLNEWDLAESNFRKAQSVFRSVLPNNDPLFAELYSNLGYTDESQGNYDSARVYFQKALSTIRSQPEIDSALFIQEMRNVARSHYRLGETAVGDSMLYAALGFSKSFHGQNDIVTSSVLNDLGLYSMTNARYDSARSHFNRSLEIKNQVYGENGHPNYSATLTNLAVLEETFSNFNLAESLYTKALIMDMELFGNEHLNVGIAKNHLANIAYKKGEYEKSKRLREESIDIYKSIYQPSHSSFGNLYKNYGQTLTALQEYQKADHYFELAESIISTNKYATNRDLANFHHLKAENHYHLKEYAEASDDFRDAIRNYAELSHPYFNIPSAMCSLYLSESLFEMKQTTEALKILGDLKAKMDTTEILQNNSEVQDFYNQIIVKIQ